MTPGLAPTAAFLNRPWQRPALLLAGGAALGLSFPPFGLNGLAFIALVPLLLHWDQASSWRSALTAAYAAFLATFAVAFSWPLNHALPNVALASLTGVLLLPLWMALPFAAAWPVRQRLGRMPGLAALCGWYLCMEAALSIGPLALPWPLLGHTQAEAPAFNQFADVTGVPGLSLWVLLLNGLLLLWIEAPSSRHRAGYIVAAVLVLATPYLYGTWRLARIDPGTASLRVGLVQPGLDPLTWADQADERRVEVLLALSDSLAASAPGPLDLIVWPETALPLSGGPEEGRQLLQRIQEWSDRHRMALLSGAVTVTPGEQGGRRYRNAALLFQPEQPTQTYDKRRLVPFAEQALFSDYLVVPAGGVAGYRPGRSDAPLRLGNVQLGLLICLESVFGDLGRQYAVRGAGFLVVLTQDGWWGRSAGYRQHLAFTRLRAIETRRAVVQVSVSGETALILPEGSTAGTDGWMQRTAQVVAVPLLRQQTFFTRHGAWLNWIALAMALSFSALAVAYPLLRPRPVQTPA